MWTVYAIPFLIIAIILLAGPQAIRELIDLVQEIGWWISDKFQKKPNIITTPTSDYWVGVTEEKGNYGVKDWLRKHCLEDPKPSKGLFIRSLGKEDDIISEVNSLLKQQGDV